MKKILFFLVLSSTLVYGQKKEKIDYYTDSDVKRDIISLQLGYMPYYTGRRLLSATANPQADYAFLNSAITGKFGQGYGGDVLFHITKNVDFGLGLYKSSTHYQWDFESIVNNLPGGNTDTIGIKRWDLFADYLTVPIQFGFVTRVADQLWLQVYPALELNFLQQMTYDYELNGQMPLVIDKTQVARDLNLAINFGLGAEYRFLEKMGFFTRLQFRYFFYPAIEDEVITELVYTVGGHIGLRYHF
jgi:hypothetical protein